jgi:hypothetical protein
MKRMATPLLVLLVASVASVTLTSIADAALRVPQVVVNGGGLQAFFNVNDPGINASTDQDANATWSHTVSGTATHSLVHEDVGASHTYTLYNAGEALPAFFPVIGGLRIPGAFSTTTFLAGNVMRVNAFDENANFLFQVNFNNVDNTNFGLGLEVPQFIFTQDFRNPGGLPRALVYRGTGQNAGTWWVCWEAGTDNDFDDVIVNVESVNPTPVSRTNWGTLKARFR